MNYPIFELQRPDYLLSTDPARLDLAVIHHFLTNCYWSPGIPRSIVERAVAGSVSFGIHATAGGQVGFGRIITDGATFGYLADVFVLPEHRGRGLGRWLVESMLAHPSLQGFRTWLLATQDAHGLYANYGFQPLPHPERYLVLPRAHPYRTSPATG